MASTSNVSLSSDQHDDDDIPVLREDQEKISNFSRLDFSRKDHMLEASSLKEEVQRLKDALEEATLCMEPDGLLLKIGESFIGNLDELEITDVIEERQTKATEKLEKIENELHAIVSEMEGLKAALYAKFGSKRINLEFE